MTEELKNGWVSLNTNFLDEQEADFLFNELLFNAPWKQGEIKLFGKTISIPRKEVFYADHGLSYTYSGQKLDTQEMPDMIMALRKKLECETGYLYNSVLINLYRDGSDSNGWHADNEKELGTNPVIASLSLGVTRRFDLKHIHSGERKSFALNHGSLLVMGGELQHFWKHQIAKSARINTPRINLTFRNIQRAM